jgi:transposase InsO family protein
MRQLGLRGRRPKRFRRTTHTEPSRAPASRVTNHHPASCTHTDRRSTYTASAYRKRIDQLGMIASMRRKGNCWDNAVAESTIGTVTCLRQS